MKNNITEIVFILDRSGSMCALEEDTIGGFNSMIKEQKEKDGVCYVSTVLFNERSQVLHDRVKLEDVPEMTGKDYRASGSTALIDALGDAIHHIGNIHKYARKEDVPENTLFVITTDGMENASHKYSSSEVKRMIEHEKEKYGWKFVFLGANIDAVETARRYGMDEDLAMNYNPDRLGTAAVYRSLSKVAGNVRSSKSINAECFEDISVDNNSRK